MGKRRAQQMWTSRIVCWYDGGRCKGPHPTVPQSAKVEQILTKVKPPAEQSTDQSSPPDLNSHLTASSEDSLLPILREPVGQKGSPKVLIKIVKSFQCRWKDFGFGSLHANPGCEADSGYDLNCEVLRFGSNRNCASCLQIWNAQTLGLHGGDYGSQGVLDSPYTTTVRNMEMLRLLTS